MTVEGIQALLARFDTVFSTEVSEDDIWKHLRNSLDGRTLYTYGYTVPVGYTDLLFSFKEKKEVTGRDLIDLGLSIHDFTLNEVEIEVGYLKALEQFNKIAKTIGKEDERTTSGLTLPKTDGGRFSAWVQRESGEWEIQLNLERRGRGTGPVWTPPDLDDEEDSSSLEKPMVRLGIRERESKYRSYYSEGSGGRYTEDPKAAEDRIRILESKEFNNLVGSGFLLEIKVDLPGRYSQREPSYITVEKQKKSAYERVIETLRAREDTKIYNPEELVKRLGGFRATHLGQGQDMEIVYEGVKDVRIKSLDISKKGWENLKNIATDALRAVS